MRPIEIKEAADNFGVSMESATLMRIRYLQSLLGLWMEYIDEQTNEMPESDVMAIIGELIAIRNYQDSIKSGRATQTITDEMVQQARAYPIERVVEFTKGTAIAFCHSDQKPSLAWHKAKNKATCFPCGKSFSALDVCIERDGMPFVEAVKYLAGR